MDFRIADSFTDSLLSYGVPPEWMADVRAATRATLFDVAEHLPREAAEALVDLATGTKPPIGPGISPKIDAFDHPNAQRRFRVINNVEELERDYSGPARVSGSAGTGKTIVALHRAVHLARADRDARFLLTTFAVAAGERLFRRDL